jgi:predicted aldo/keto reductase-like oxidoreductase
MNKRALGQSNLEVSAVGYGCMVLTPIYGTSISRADAVTFIRGAVERAASRRTSVRRAWSSRRTTSERSKMPRPRST